MAIVTRRAFETAMEALWTEIEYQNNLERRTVAEARDVPGFLLLMRYYIRETETEWATNKGIGQSQHGLRKLAAIGLRSMVYCGVVSRTDDITMDDVTPSQPEKDPYFGG